jgi:hypothetical protein
MKLRVAYPPPLKRNGDSRGKRLRNQVSKAHARLLFLFQWAANPPIKCGQPWGTPTLV